LRERVLLRRQRGPRRTGTAGRPSSRTPTPRTGARMQIRSATPEDAAAIAAIYNPYVAGTCITFETEPVATAEMAARISETLDGGLPWLVAEEAGTILGYAHASRWKGRCAYRY